MLDSCISYPVYHSIPRRTQCTRGTTVYHGYYRVLHCTTGYHSVPQGTTVYYRVPQCTAGYQSVPPCTKVYQGVLQYSKGYHGVLTCMYFSSHTIYFTTCFHDKFKVLSLATSCQVTSTFNTRSHPFSFRWSTCFFYNLLKHHLSSCIFLFWHQKK